MASTQWPLRVRSQDVRKLEFHTSPVACSSLPQVQAGKSGTSSSTRRACSSSVLSRCAPPAASARSGITPRRQRWTS